MDKGIKSEELKNKGFSMIHNIFIEKDWYLKTNENDLLIYEKNKYPCDNFTIKINSNNMTISVPIGISKYCYKTTFNYYFDACSYILLHLNNFEENYNTHD